VGTQAAINFHLLKKARASGRVNLYHQVWVVRVIDHRSVVPPAEKPPRFGDMADFHGVVGIDALNSEPGE
jgi:hypothetical protein